MVMLVISVTCAFGVAAYARPFGPSRKGRGMGWDSGGFRAFLELNLTETQRADMLTIINKYQDERQTLRNTAVEARRNLQTVLNVETFNEEAVRKALREKSDIREEMFILRIKMTNELKAVLTAEQLELLEERKSQRRERITDRLSKRLERMSE